MIRKATTVLILFHQGEQDFKSFSISVSNVGVSVHKIGLPGSFPVDFPTSKHQLEMHRKEKGKHVVDQDFGG